ncbi:MAG: M4 family metallopeptidase [Bacteroidetes bacterium]|nr:M4 family metallopeptidase [Fibrella sp.]
MKLLYTLLSLGVAGITLAQPPATRTGFDRKRKTSLPTPGLAKRLGAEVATPPPGRQTRSALTNGRLTTQPLSVRVVRDTATGLPLFIESRRSTPSAKGARLSAGQVSQLTFDFLGQVRSLLQVERPDEQFVISQTETDELGQTHVRLRQTYAGLPVYGGDLVLHLTGDATTLNGRYQRLPATPLSTRPALTEKQALTRAHTDLGKKAIARPFGNGLLKQITGDESGELCFYPVNGALALAYSLTVWPTPIRCWHYIIDAKTGTVLDKYANTCAIDGPAQASARDLNGTTRTVQSYRTGNAYDLIDVTRTMFSAQASKMPDSPVGTIWTVDANFTFGDKLAIRQVRSTTNADWNATAVSAQYNAITAYNYFRTTHNRNSIDSKGGNVISIINVNDEEDGKSLENAYWSGKVMVYGNGGTSFRPLAGSLDVAGHEMAHGITQYSAGLEYKTQSGAINESMSDVFGVLIDRANWTVGESVVQRSAYPSGALRSMADPNQGGTSLRDRGWQPKTMSQYQNLPNTEEGDNGGVHVNSGIPNYAFYLFATNNSVGRDKAEKVYYRALTQYLTRTAQFLDLRLAIIKATSDLFGPTGAEATAARAAFDAVGITDGTTAPPKNDRPVAQGQDLLLLTDSKDSKLYSTVVGVTPAKFDLKSKSSLTYRPSVTDNGKFAYYVGTDKRIYAVDLTVANPAEQVISNETIWSNVAIAKDGSKLAALTDEKDASIWVYSFVLKKWKQFKLYSPTTAQNVTTNDVEYADSFEWDYSGETLVYDAFNAISATSGKSIDYWDVNFIQVWDNAKSDFATGAIEKLINNLEDGESIGNPSFSRNSPDVIAFDYFNETDDTYLVIAADLSKGDLKSVYKNNTLGFPSYSRLDNRLAFSKLSSADKEEVGIIGLAADKISPSGTVTTAYIDAKWPVWYTLAERVTAAKTAQTITFNAIADRYTNDGNLTLTATASSGLTVSFAVVSGPAQLTGNVLRMTGGGTIRVRAVQDGNTQFAAAAPVERAFTALVVTALDPTVGSDLRVYPNPATATLTIDSPGQPIETLTLTNLVGAVVQTKAAGRMASTMLNLQNLPSGVYLLTIKTAAGTAHRRVVKE